MLLLDHHALTPDRLFQEGAELHCTANSEKAKNTFPVFPSTPQLIFTLPHLSSSPTQS